ncbi:NUDIX domain-containing protein [Candidatus Saccharibacteria bacterium oral taxon 488]|jgi:NUDIX domain|nr:NUDIX domain-containing protein [Candidatus Saccharibacteria bacterium oral taxon 488]
MKQEIISQDPDLKVSVLKTSFVYRNQVIQAEWFDVDDKTVIPDLPWQQIYVIGDLDGKVPLVYYAHGRENLPGGHTEPGETLEQTLCREVQEELNVRVAEWRPIGYQVLTNPDGRIDHQFRAVAKLEKLGEFAGDVGGSVIGYRLVDIDEVNQRIGYGDIGERMIARAKNILKSMVIVRDRIFKKNIKG